MRSTDGRGDGMRVLVAIANHGTRNQRFLQVLLEEYRKMDHDVDLVLLSDRPKDVGPDVEVLVGAPTDDPWSLPFAHRQLFADRADRYDLYVYSEDDTLLTQRHLEAFVEVDRLLPDDEVPGFQRFEVHPSGERSYCSNHSSYRWLPGSANVVGGEVFADHTNLHSACYVLTRAQLRTAVDSGGFLVEPHAGPFDMLVSAATDPYLHCGLRRRLCLTRIDDFLVHHLPNVYLGKLGIDEVSFRTQVDAVIQVAKGELSAEELCDPTSKLPTPRWDVRQYPAPPPAALRELVPPRPGRALSIGTTSGAIESVLLADASAVVVVPLDEIVGALARNRGFPTLRPSLDALDDLAHGPPFDTVLLHELLHHVPVPSALLRRLHTLTSPGGTLVVSLPNVAHHRLRQLARRPDTAPVPKRGFADDGVHAPGPRFLRQVGARAGVRWHHVAFEPASGLARLDRWMPRTADRWLGPRLHAAGRFTSSPGAATDERDPHG
jgi:SAM-dependent methyltransferase